MTLVADRVAEVGGMEQMLWRLIQGLLDRDFEVTVVARRCDLPPHPRLRWARVPAPSRPFVLAYPWFFIVGSIVTAVRRRGVLNTTGALVLNRADVSTVHLCHHGLQAKTDLVRARKPGLLYRLNAIGAARLSRAAERWCYRSRRTRRLVAVSSGLAKEISRWVPGSLPAIEVIPNGVDRDTYAPNQAKRSETRKALGLSDEQPVALFVGGDWERKGLKHAIDAVAAVPGWHLVVVGRGDISRYGRHAGAVAPGRVSFVGEQTDTSPYYAGADLFVLPTAYETFSISLHEAAASSLVLLVTRVSGAVDLVAEGHNGWFIDRDPGVIAARLRQLDSDRDVMQSMGTAAREATKDLTWERVVEAYADLYGRLDEAHGP